MPRFSVSILLTTALLALAACSGPVSRDEASSQASDGEDARAILTERMEQIDEMVTEWREAETFDDAAVAAETAANLVVGPNGPGYGDRNGDGAVTGENGAGVLPGLDGTPEGLARPLEANSCVTRDVLGGSWEDPAAEWQAMEAAIEDWRPDNNTMPTLASHPMRIVGWATLTIESDSLDLAHEYGGHAALHVDVAVDALDC